MICFNWNYKKMFVWILGTCSNCWQAKATFQRLFLLFGWYLITCGLMQIFWFEMIYAFLFWCILRQYDVLTSNLLHIFFFWFALWQQMFGTQIPMWQMNWEMVFSVVLWRESNTPKQSWLFEAGCCFGVLHAAWINVKSKPRTSNHHDFGCSCI